MKVSNIMKAVKYSSDLNHYRMRKTSHLTKNLDSEIVRQTGRQTVRQTVNQVRGCWVVHHSIPAPSQSEAVIRGD